VEPSEWLLILVGDAHDPAAGQPVLVSYGIAARPAASFYPPVIRPRAGPARQWSARPCATHDQLVTPRP